jgi:hypothetical protein
MEKKLYTKLPAGNHLSSPFDYGIPRNFHKFEIKKK